VGEGGAGIKRGGSSVGGVVRSLRDWASAQPRQDWPDWGMYPPNPLYFWGLGGGGIIQKRLSGNAALTRARRCPTKSAAEGRPAER
jgi:hypothetical protein